MSNPPEQRSPWGFLDQYGQGVAVVSDDGEHTFAYLSAAADSTARALTAQLGNVTGARVGLLVAPDHRFAASILGIWKAGAVAVPLATTHPEAELDHVVRDSAAAAIVTGGEFLTRASEVAERVGSAVVDVADLPDDRRETPQLPPVDDDDRALIIYTSGSTGRPKGVVWRHRHVKAQIAMMTEAWRWTRDDRSLLVLPLHHVHGLVNVMLTSLGNGATCEMAGAFDAPSTLRRLSRGEVSVFMAVPTVYRRLISAFDALGPRDRAATTAALRNLRLMVSGSAALPVSTLERWREISGHTLLERYGMTEIGMALTNPYDGPRRPGSVGRPFPEVDVRIVDDSGRPLPEGSEGEIEVRGPTVFDEYWDRPTETALSFRDGWFRTGDAAVVEDGAYRILGRISVDIIKTGGEKVSAIEVEDAVRTVPGVEDCAVVGVPDADWGQRVAAAVVTGDGADLSLDDLRAFLRYRLAPEKLPRDMVVVAALPRNAMGKVTKHRVVELFSRDGSAEW